jgi:hypothetical protein
MILTLIPTEVNYRYFLLRGPAIDENDRIEQVCTMVEEGAIIWIRHWVTLKVVGLEGAHIKEG